MNFKLLYLPAKLKSLIIAPQTAHRTEVTTLSFPKPWLSCFPLVFMPLPTTPSSSPKLGTLAPPPARTFWKCVTCSFFCFSSSSFPFTFHHCPNSEAPSSLSSDTSQSSLWRHPCQSCPHSGIPRILQKSILHSSWGLTLSLCCFWLLRGSAHPTGKRLDSLGWQRWPLSRFWTSCFIP